MRNWAAGCCVFASSPAKWKLPNPPLYTNVVNLRHPAGEAISLLLL